MKVYHIREVVVTRRQSIYRSGNRICVESENNSRSRLIYFTPDQIPELERAIELRSSLGRGSIRTIATVKSANGTSIAIDTNGSGLRLRFLFRDGVLSHIIQLNSDEVDALTRAIADLRDHDGNNAAA